MVNAVVEPNEIADSSTSNDQNMEEATSSIQNVSNQELEKIESKSTKKQSSPVKLTSLLITQETNTSNVEIALKPNPVIDNQCEKSNESQVETTSSETSEKEHNKSISRELKSLINYAKESKIINECTQLKSKTRKSRTALETSSSSLNNSVEAEKIPARRNSNNSSKSNCSGKSEKQAKRSMRSQNPEFVNKVKQFLSSVTGKIHRNSDEESDTDASKNKKDAQIDATSTKKKSLEGNQVQTTEKKLRVDPYCWRCNWVAEPNSEKTHSPLHCTVCPRAYHYKCLSGTERNKISSRKTWVCPECILVLQAESSETRSPAMKKISLGLLCELLQHALARMMDLNGVEPFINPVDRKEFPDYDKYVVHPMDLNLIKQNITKGLYGSTEAFLADVQWILHNSIIFNTFRLCRSEMGEIEACPECYAGAYGRKATWFTDVFHTGRRKVCH
ncbi:unnamed protein product [Leptidea sinapis]|uniref:PHD-type domain-containing protein n=1 Tax=Leptidea sinapis TaxID=189913 RepID=A0A5E4Q630_9NEOP|nr:unnamed protein product [Leptidea sinapis]